MNINKNMGGADRVFRLLFAAVVVVLYFTHVISVLWAIVLGIAAGIFVLTALVGVCPLYSLFGIRTCPRK